MIKHVLNATDISKQGLEYIISVANIIAANPSRFGKIAQGKILATLFFEPSTRTRLSFESAMHRLGGSVIGFSDMSTSSSVKGESLEDTTRIISNYSDIMVVRHPEAFAPHKMSKVASVPVINAGDGANEHPTQTLADLATIKRRFGRLSNLTIGLCGDLKYGRTTHSLVKVLSRYPNNTFYFISPPELQMPEEILEIVERSHCEAVVTTDLETTLPKVDVLYMTRIQKERFDTLEAYEALKGCYILDREKMQLAKEDMIVLHPLPRVDEISTYVDDDPRAWYFIQAQTGVYARMALIILQLGLQNQVGKEVLHVTSHKEYHRDRLSYIS